jgi:hypothetical protein
LGWAQTILSIRSVVLLQSRPAASAGVANGKTASANNPGHRLPIFVSEGGVSR